MSRIYGIHPWQVEQMPLREITEYLRDLDVVIEQHNNQGG